MHDYLVKIKLKYINLQKLHHPGSIPILNGIKWKLIGTVTG
jgi:hypothetical protein